MAREGFDMPDPPFDSMSRFADVVAKQRLEYIARTDRAVADLKELAWDLIEMEFAPDTPDGSVHRERYRAIRKRVNDIADGCYGIEPEPAGDASFAYGPVVAGPELAAELHCDRCNLDAHRCPGCGVPVDHGTTVCASCAVPVVMPACAYCGGSGVKCCEFGADR